MEAVVFQLKVEVESSVVFQNLWVEEDKRLLAETVSRRWKTL